MPDLFPEQLRSAVSAELSDVVRLDQQRPDFAIAEWSVAPMSTQGMAHPGGLYSVHGWGYAGAERRSWSVVLKLLHEPSSPDDPRDIWYWKRELLAAQAGLIPRLAGPVATPRIYALMDEGPRGRIWLEHLADDSPARWGLAQFRFAAREIGRMNGAQLRARPVADDPWLVQEHCRWWLASVHQPAPADIWANPWVARAFGPLRPRIAALWQARAEFLAMLRRLPQVVSHFDLHRRNLFVRHGRLAAIDWGLVGAGALGGDLFGLLGSSALLLELAPEDFAAVEAAAFDAYLGGLADAGWRGDADAVRLAYTAWSALWLGAVTADCAAGWTRDPTGELARRQFGCGNAELAETWAALCAHALDHADEARRISAQLSGEHSLARGGRV